MTSINNFIVTDNVTDILAAQYNGLLGSIMRADISNATTMSGTVALTDADTAIQRFDCNGSNRIVTLPVYATTNHPFFIINVTAATYTLDVQSSGSVTILSSPLPALTGIALVIPDGTAGFRCANNLPKVVASQFWLSGRGALASLTNGFTAGTQFEQATNKQNFLLPSFPAAAQRYGEWEMALPSDYGSGTITYQAYWLANSTSTNSVVWGLQGCAYAATDTIDQAWGTAVETTSANQSTAYKLNISSVSSAVTLSGSPAANQLVKWRCYRLGSGSDNLAVAASLVGFQINYTRT